MHSSAVVLLGMTCITRMAGLLSCLTMSTGSLPCSCMRSSPTSSAVRFISAAVQSTKTPTNSGKAPTLRRLQSIKQTAENNEWQIAESASHDGAAVDGECLSA